MGTRCGGVNCSVITSVDDVYESSERAHGRLGV